MSRRPLARWKTEAQVKPNPTSFDASKPKVKPGTPEHDYQVTQIEYLRIQFPRWVIFSIPNEAMSATKNRRATVQWQQDREDAGRLTGIVDVVALGPFPAAVLIENKSKDGWVRHDQKAIHKQLRELGWNVHVSRSLDDLIPWLKSLHLIRS
jgi:hypothetical protein